MKKIIVGFVLFLGLFVFGINPGMVGHAQANPLFAQVPQSSATPEPLKAPAHPTPPTANQPTPQPSQSPVVAQPKPPKEQSSGPYDMEAMKAFNRALYGS